MPFYQVGRGQAITGVRQWSRFVGAYGVPAGEQYYSGRNLGAALRWAIANDYNVVVDVQFRSLVVSANIEYRDGRMAYEIAPDGSGQRTQYRHGIHPYSLINEIGNSSPAAWFAAMAGQDANVLEASGVMGYTVTYLPVQDRTRLRGG